jgi:aerobic-type carbon monoxide dehydrogenase small subunit (CoxS/CutS family)
VQCGYYKESGKKSRAATALLTTNKPKYVDIDAMSGNICRCDFIHAFAALNKPR